MEIIIKITIFNNNIYKLITMNFFFKELKQKTKTSLINLSPIFFNSLSNLIKINQSPNLFPFPLNKNNKDIVPVKLVNCVVRQMLMQLSYLVVITLLVLSVLGNVNSALYAELSLKIL